jgi:hypothetical protein
MRLDGGSANHMAAGSKVEGHPSGVDGAVHGRRRRAALRMASVCPDSFRRTGSVAHAPPAAIGKGGRAQGDDLQGGNGR